MSIDFSTPGQVYAVKADMRVAIMQPYFVPYLGYFHLIDAVDVFVILDTVDYPKGGWVNRNRVLVQSRDTWLTFPVGSSGSRILEKNYVMNHRYFSKVQRTVSRAYPKSARLPEFQSMLEDWWRSPLRNVSEVNLFFIKWILERLGRVPPTFVQAQSFDTDGARGQDRIVKIASILGARTYVNLAGGQKLYHKTAFLSEGIELLFVQSRFPEYKQASHAFVPRLSVLDFFLNETRDSESWIGPESYGLSRADEWV